MKIEKEWMAPEVKERLAEEIIQIFKRENLTIRNAWSVCSEVRAQINDLAYNKKINENKLNARALERLMNIDFGEGRGVQIKIKMEETNLNSAASKENKGSVIFISDAHEKFYCENMKKVRNRDEYHEALIYCLGICNDTRKNIDRIYDFKTGYVKPECLREGWQTSGSAKVTRMAFNLYCGNAPSVHEYENAEEQMDEYKQYTAEKLFCCAYAPYFWQAIQLRYPEYATYDHSLYAAFGSAD